MTTVAPTNTSEIGNGDGSLNLYTWALTTANSDGAPVHAAEWADRTWQATGTFGGATVAFQGSNDGSNWFSMTNAAGGAAIALTAAGGATTIESPYYVRPNLTVVGSGATITVTLLARRAQPLRM
jgi:hypothetical protein